MIDKKPAVGRIIFGEAANQDQILGPRLGPIVKISGQRIVYRDDSGKERLIYKIGAACDTVEEADDLQHRSEQYSQSLANFRQGMTYSFHESFPELKA